MAHPILFMLTLAFALTAFAPVAVSEIRTANRTASGHVWYPDFLFAKPEHYRFLPLTSNHDAQHQHPQQWEGQDWDPAGWDDTKWTPEITLKKLFAGRVFAKHYLRDASKHNNNKRITEKVPVLEVGPMFFKLSDLDQRRSLKLLADFTQIFEHGHNAVELQDWYTKRVVGSYTPVGMHLN